MQRWRKPPIFALAYISPARSSKRRISAIRSRMATHVSRSGSGCFCPSPPSLRCSVSCSTAMGPDDTPCRAARTRRAVRSGSATRASPPRARVASDRRMGAMVARAPDALLSRMPRIAKLPRPSYRAAWLLGAGAFVLYAVTLTHGVSWDDSAELAAGVSRLGIVHSTGYPPYVLLGHAFTLVEPFGSDATRANLWSALAAAGAIALGARYVLVLTGSTAAAVLAGALLALGPVFWFQATVASVYPLLAFGVALLLNAADAWLRRPTPGRLALVSGSIGLVALAHTGGLAFAVGGIALIASRGRAAVRGWRDALALAAVAIPIASIAYIPLRGDYAGFPNRGGLSVWQMVFGTSGTFSGDTPLTASRHGVGAHSWALVVLLVVSLSPAAFALVPLGLRRLWRERPYLLCCLAPALLDSVLVVTMRGGFAYWHVPLLLAGAIACGAGLDPLRALLRERGRAGAAIGAALAASLVVAPVTGALFLANSDRSAAGWSRATLAALPHGARLVAPWTAYAPLRAEQTLRGTRRDVRVELTSTGLTPDLATLRGGYAVVVTAAAPAAPGVALVGPVAGASFKGLSGLRAGPFRIGYGSISARTYRLPD